MNIPICSILSIQMYELMKNAHLFMNIFTFVFIMFRFGLRFMFNFPFTNTLIFITNTSIFIIFEYSNNRIQFKCNSTLYRHRVSCVRCIPINIFVYFISEKTESVAMIINTNQKYDWYAHNQPNCLHP